MNLISKFLPCVLCLLCNYYASQTIIITTSSDMQAPSTCNLRLSYAKFY